jgi:hypothetical protein
MKKIDQFYLLQSVIETRKIVLFNAKIILNGSNRKTKSEIEIHKLMLYLNLTNDIIYYKSRLIRMQKI